jgi:hypothetical protein
MRFAITTLAILRSAAVARLAAFSLTALLLMPLLASAQYTKLTAPEPAERDHYGISVAIGGGIAVVGANGDDEAGENRGAIYVYRIDGGTPTPEAKLLPVRPGQFSNQNLHFGLRLDTDGTRVVTGIHSAVRIGTFFPPVGAVAVYAPQNGGWAEEAYIENPADESHDFGFGVAIDGDIMVIGAPGDRKDERNSGRAYIYRLEDSEWTLEEVLSPPTAIQNQRFGEAVGVDGGRVIVGAPGNAGLPFGSNGTGVYVYADGGDGTWTQEANLTRGTPLEQDRFGANITLSGDRVLVAGASVAAGHLFLRAGDGTWSEEAVLALPSDNRSGARAGAMVGDKVVLGAFMADGVEDKSGVAYVFNRSDDGWSDPILIQADDGTEGDNFGHSVATDGQHVLVGALGKVEDDFTYAGAAYLFSPSATYTELLPALPSLQIESPYPNPFRFTTLIGMTLERTQPVDVAVYDALGRRVGLLHEGLLSSGTHRFSFDALKLPSGIYFIRVATPEILQTRAVILQQ